MTEQEAFFNRWLTKTVKVLHEELQKKNVGITDELRRSLREEMRRLGEGYLEGRIYFEQRGRFVDMGSGRGYSMGRKNSGVFESNAPRRGRKPKKWYSPAFYGRLNDLEGVVGIKLMEQAIETIVQPMKGI